MSGKLQVYHGRNYTVLTNDPPLPEQIANVRRYQPFTRRTVPPGDIASASRFVRLAYFLNYVPKTMDSMVMTGEMRSIIGTAAAPLGAPADDEPELGVYPTWWTSLTDYTARIYYWGWVMNPNFIWVDMNTLLVSGKLEEGSPTLQLNPRNLSLVGDVLAAFLPLTNSVPPLETQLSTTNPMTMLEMPLPQVSACFVLTIAGGAILFFSGGFRAHRDGLRGPYSARLL